MWKIIVAFIIFSALAIYMLSKGGDIDMGGEKHGVDAHAPTAAETAPAASAAAEAASAAAMDAISPAPASAASN
jgi:hypothetical protein